MNKVKQSSSKTFIIGTEKGVAERLQRDFPKKTFTLNAFRQISKFTIAEGKLSDNWSSLTDSIDLVYRS